MELAEFTVKEERESQAACEHSSVRSETVTTNLYSNLIRSKPLSCNKQTKITFFVQLTNTMAQTLVVFYVHYQTGGQIMAGHCN